MNSRRRGEERGERGEERGERGRGCSPPRRRRVGDEAVPGTRGRSYFASEHERETGTDEFEKQRSGPEPAKILKIQEIGGGVCPKYWNLPPNIDRRREFQFWTQINSAG